MEDKLKSITTFEKIHFIRTLSSIFFALYNLKPISLFLSTKNNEMYWKKILFVLFKSIWKKVERRLPCFFCFMSLSVQSYLLKKVQGVIGMDIIVSNLKAIKFVLQLFCQLCRFYFWVQILSPGSFKTLNLVHKCSLYIFYLIVQ